MKTTRRMLGAAMAGIMIAATAGAQTTTQLGVGGGGSAHVKTDWTISGAHISISYGRPKLKGRAESQLMPLGQPWRTGADEATVLTTDKPLIFGKVQLAPGSYTINTEPGEKSWTLIFGRLDKPGQWGIPYQPALEIGRAPMTLGKLVKPEDELTISIDRIGPRQSLTVQWGTVSASAPFTIGR